MSRMFAVGLDSIAATKRQLVQDRMGRRAVAAAVLMVCMMGVGLSAQQQVVDESFKVTVEHPLFARGTGPAVAIDEAHSNFHTAGGQYKPLADLLGADGYRVAPSTRQFEPEVLAGVKVLVVSNARNLAAILAGDITKPAFTEHECDVVRDWVRAGGSLLLIADHAPFGNAAAILGQRFGVAMGKGWTFDRARSGGITTQLDFFTTDGSLGDHPVLRGRNASEAITHLRSFTGQSLGVPDGASILMRLSPTARDAATPADMDAEDAAEKGLDPAARGKHSSAPAGPAQGIAMPFGAGRVVVLGEAAMLSAQLLRFADGSEARFGMNVPGNDDRQFALNIFHWLSGVLR